MLRRRLGSIDMLAHRSLTLAATRSSLSAPARLAAARAVLTELGPAPVAVALAYRLAEFAANVLLFGGMLWLVTPWALLPVFALLWYLPAAVHTRSGWAPLRYPLLNFVVDDFSLLGLHPHLRCARAMYKVMVFRVLLMFLALLLLSSWSFLPQSVIDWLHHGTAMQAIARIKPNGTIPKLVRGVWHLLGAAVVVLSAVWVVVTVVLLSVPRCRGRATPFFAPRRDLLLDRVGALATEVHQIAMLRPLEEVGAAAECREALARLRDERFPGLRLTNVFTTFGPAWAAILHFGTDCFNVFTFVKHGDFLFAAFLILTMWVSLTYAWVATDRGPHRIYQETKLSLDCGVVTHDFLVMIRADKGFQMIPALLLQVYGLPYAAQSWTTALAAAGSIGATVLFVVPFIHHDYDLGIEREGLEIVVGQANAPDRAAAAVLDRLEQPSRFEPRCPLEASRTSLQELSLPQPPTAAVAPPLPSPPPSPPPLPLPEQKHQEPCLLSCDVPLPPAAPQP